MYNQKVLQHFLNPANAGGIKKADAVGKVGSVDGSDIVKFYLIINPETLIIENAQFKAFGGPATIACADVACELLKDKTLDEAKQISNMDIINMLDEIPMEKIYCATTVEDAIRETISSYTINQ